MCLAPASKQPQENSANFLLILSRANTRKRLELLVERFVYDPTPASDAEGK
jgi:hypothetical protein